MSEPHPRPPADALLWRLERRACELVCFVVSGDDGRIAVCVEDDERGLVVAESFDSVPAP